MSDVGAPYFFSAGAHLACGVPATGVPSECGGRAEELAGDVVAMR